MCIPRNDHILNAGLFSFFFSEYMQFEFLHFVNLAHIPFRFLHYCYFNLDNVIRVFRARLTGSSENLFLTMLDFFRIIFLSLCPSASFAARRDLRSSVVLDN